MKWRLGAGRAEQAERVPFQEAAVARVRFRGAVRIKSFLLDLATRTIAVIG